MYTEFYGLQEYPFNITPDPGFIVFTPTYNELLARLYYGIETAKGLIILSGEVGTGKTTALRWILHRLDSTVLAAYIYNPGISVDEFYYQLAKLLNINEWSNKAELLMQLGKFLENRHNRGLRTVLIVDEAHELSDALLEEIRLLMNFESNKAKHLQVILSGQPELIEKLNQTNLRQFRQRVTLNCKMKSLASAEETEEYIAERLMIAGNRQADIFTPDAIELIYQCSEGIPRQINNICDNAMLTAYEKGLRTIDRNVILEVAEELYMLPDKKNGQWEDGSDGTAAASRVVEKRVLSEQGIEELLSKFEPKVQELTVSDVLQPAARMSDPQNE